MEEIKMKISGTSIVAILLVVIAVAVSGCSSTSPAVVTTPETTHGFIEPDGVGSADVIIIMGAGELTVQGGADTKNLMESTVITTNPEWRPVIVYNTGNAKGNLRITQKENSDFKMFTGNQQNRWEILLNNAIPLSLEVKTGVGDANLNLGMLNLTSLQVKIGTGNQVIDFTGYSPTGPDSEILCGVGNITVRVPRGMNSRITIDKGLGNIRADGFLIKDGAYWVSGSPSAATTVTNIHVKQGVGSVTLVAV
jgi:hypothetical protein